MKTKTVGIAGRMRRVRRLVGTQGQQGTNQHTPCSDRTSPRENSAQVNCSCSHTHHSPQALLLHHTHGYTNYLLLHQCSQVKTQQPFIRHQNQYLLGNSSPRYMTLLNKDSSDMPTFHQVLYKNTSSLSCSLCCSHWFSLRCPSGIPGAAQLWWSSLPGGWSHTGQGSL